jgi:transposase
LGDYRCPLPQAWHNDGLGIRKRLFNAAIHVLRTRVDRTFAWEDKFKRLLLRFEHLQQRHFGMKLMAYTLINVREFCGA